MARISDRGCPPIQHLIANMGPMRLLDSYLMTSTQHDSRGRFCKKRTEVLSVLSGGSDKIGDPHAEQFGGVESPLSRPQEFGTWTLELRRSFTWTLH